MNGANPWYRRSMMGGIILYLVSTGCRWGFEGIPPGTLEVVTLTTMVLTLFGYQVKHPTGPVKPS